MKLEEISLQLKHQIEKTDWESFWPGFSLVAFCLYDEQEVHIFNHPSFPESGQDVRIIPWEERFVGDTLILFHDYPTAIVKVTALSNLHDVYATVVHELFHGHQSLMNEQRFPDELVAVEYPLLLENVTLRMQEREALMRAFYAKDTEERLMELRRFVACRTERRALIGEPVEYENRLETVEGPSFYVEVLAYRSVTGQSLETVLEPYSERLLDHYASHLYLRRSCYYSGLLQCLLLDELQPGWRELFFTEQRSLFQLLSGLVSEVSLSGAAEVREAVQVYEYVRDEKEKMIESFDRNEGVKVVIEGAILTTFFDPMNMICFNQRLLHQYFVKVRINGRDYLINQPALVEYGEDLLQARRLSLVLEEVPVYRDDRLVLDGIGEIEGRLESCEGCFRLVV